MEIPDPIILSERNLDLSASRAVLGDGPGVYAVASGHSIIHLGSSMSLTRRVSRLLSSRLDADRTTSPELARELAVHCWLTGSKLASSLLLYELSRRSFPEDYPRRLRLRMPWFVTIVASDEFPRLRVVDRLKTDISPTFGPFRTRDYAQRYEEALLSAFPLRRCTEKLVPHAEHPGCIYGEMNQCLRPCQCKVDVAGYRREVETVAQFMLTNGKQTIRALVAARDQAASDTDFEKAGQLHRTIEKLESALRSRDAAFSEISDFNGIALVQDARGFFPQLWLIVNGFWQSPVNVRAIEPSEPREQLEDLLRESVGRVLANPIYEGDRAEHMALFSRWYYSSWREGDWLPVTDVSRVNYRVLAHRMRRTISTG